MSAERISEPEGMDDPKYTVISRQSKTDGHINWEMVAACIRPVQVQVIGDPSPKRGKWKRAPTLNQETSCHWLIPICKGEICFLW